MPSKLTEQLVELKKEKTLFLMLVFALVAVIVWIVVGILATRKEEIIGAELRELAQPLVPTLDRSVLEGLSEKDYFSAEDLANFSIFALIELDGISDKHLVDIVNDRAELRLERDLDQVLSASEPPPSEEEGGLSDQEMMTQLTPDGSLDELVVEEELDSGLDSEPAETELLETQP